MLRPLSAKLSAKEKAFHVSAKGFIPRYSIRNNSV
jgi:hypothetical protein